MTGVLSFFQKRRVRFTIAGLALAYVLYVAISALALPSLLQHYAEKELGARLESQVHIGKITINPFRLSLTVTGFSATRPSEQPWLSFDTLLVDARLSSVFTFSINLDEFRLVAPQVRLDLRPSANDKPTDTRSLHNTFAARNQLPLQIGNFTLRNGSVALVDHRSSQTKRIALSPIGFELSDFSTRLSMGKHNLYDLNFTGPQGGLFRWKGSLQWHPFLSAGEMEIRGLDLMQFKEFYPDSLPLPATFGKAALQKGEMAFSTHYRIYEEPAIGIELEHAGVTLTQLEIGSTAPGYDQITLRKLAIEEIALDSRERRLEVGKIGIDSLAIRYTQKQNPPPPRCEPLTLAFLRYDSTQADSLVEGMDPLAVFLTQTPNLPRWKIRVDSIALHNGNVAFTDSFLVAGARQQLSSLELAAGPLTNFGPDSLYYKMHTRLQQQGLVTLEGYLRLFDLQAEAHVRIDSLPLSAMQDYANAFTIASIRQGQAFADLQARWKPDTQCLLGDTLVLTGKASVRQFVADGNGAKRIAAVSQLALEGINAQLPTRKIRIAKASAYGAAAQLQRAANGTLSIDSLLRTTPRILPTRYPGPPTPPLQIDIGQISIAKASAQITDLTLASPFLFRVTDVTGNVHRLSNHAKLDCDYQLQGKLDGYAPFKITGTANLAGTYPRINAEITTRAQELVGFSPYSGKFAGYRIAKGQVETDLSYHLADNSVQGKNRIVIRQFTFGEEVESPDATSLPVRLGVALLSDRNGVIDLDVDIEGKLDDPEFSIGGMIWKVVKNLVGKAAAAPMKALMALVGGNEDLQSITYAPGTTELAPTHRETLTKLAQALAQRPMLELEIQASLDTAGDLRYLRDRQLAQKIGAANRVAPERINAQSVIQKPLRDNLFAYYTATTQKDWKQQLRALAGNDSLRLAQAPETDQRQVASAVWQELANLQTIELADKMRLASLRAQNVKAALMAQDSALAPRLFVLEQIDTTRQGSAVWLRIGAP